MRAQLDRGFHIRCFSTTSKPRFFEILWFLKTTFFDHHKNARKHIYLLKVKWEISSVSKNTRKYGFYLFWLIVRVGGVESWTYLSWPGPWTWCAGLRGRQCSRSENLNKYNHAGSQTMQLTNTHCSNATNNYRRNQSEINKHAEKSLKQVNFQYF